MNKTVKQLEQELAAMTGERNDWREMAQTLVAKSGLPYPVPQTVPIYPWWSLSSGTTITTDNTTQLELHAPDINFTAGTIGGDDGYVTVEEIRNHLDNHQN